MNCRNCQNPVLAVSAVLAVVFKRGRCFWGAVSQCPLLHVQTLQADWPPMNKSYEIVTPPEPAMSWEAYSEIIQNEYASLLDRKDTPESDFQKFFEENPCFLPAAYGIFHAGAHGPYPGAVISQPRLPGLSEKIPDFLYITRDSESVYVILIEIEHPGKPWATKTGQPHSAFTQATHQITQWKQWFGRPENITLFQRDYRIPEDWVRTRYFQQKYILIYGRRNDLSLTEAVNRGRALLPRDDEIYMTFDRLRPQYDMQHCLCAKLDNDGYHAISVPGTFQLGPCRDVGVEKIRGKKEAVMKNRFISDIRKEFLVSRIPYWDAWSGGMCFSGDYE